MVKKNTISAQQQSYRKIKHWQPINKVLKPSDLLPTDNKYYPFFEKIYYHTKKFYTSLPKRKNGQNPFLHPINIVYALKKFHVEDGLTYCVGIMHDYIEEKVDLYKEQHNIKEDANGKKILDEYEELVVGNFHKELDLLCSTTISSEDCRILIETVKLLTRHKRHFYYKSISYIFNCKNESLRERAIRVKLADRLHNILSLESFDEKSRLYKCFKNLFILNNVKKYLLDKYGSKVFTRKKFSSTELLFDKCSKATYDAFQKICDTGHKNKILDTKPILQLAFKKFKLNHSGIAAVTRLDKKETHPMRLFQGVVWKYDARLHHEWDKFKELSEDEIDYCHKFFTDLKLSNSQIKALVEYKDAYALKEVIAHLLYEPGYYISRFLYSELSNKGRIGKKYFGL